MATLRIVLAVLLALLIASRRRWHPRKAAPATAMHELADHTVIDPGTGAVRSKQAVALLLRRDSLARITSPAGIDWLGPTYWSFLRRITLGVVRTRERERAPTLLVGGLQLMSFGAPEYDAQPGRVLVRWRIEGGLLVAPAGRGGRGYLQIALDCGADATAELSWLELGVEVEGFHPAIARLSRRLYQETQARVHVMVTHSYLRSLARRYLAEPRECSHGGAPRAAEPRRRLISRGAARRPTGAASRGRGPR